MFAGLLLGTEVLIVPIPPAAAVTCSPSNHCYGEVEYFTGTQIFGLNQGLDVRCLGPMGAPTSSNFVTQEMWERTAGNISGNWWVEVGMAYGAPQGSTRYFFWADNRPNGGGYHEHDLSISTTLGQVYDDYITWEVTTHGKYAAAVRRSARQRRTPVHPTAATRARN